MSQISVLLQQFHDDLDRTEDLLQLVRLYRAFAGSTAPQGIAHGGHPWQEALELSDIAAKVRTDLPIMSGSILLYLCGRFEHFVRETVMAIADTYVSNAGTYEELPENIKTEIFNRTLEVAKSPSKYNFDKAESGQIIRSLADLLQPTAGMPVAIESRLLTITDANMHSRMMAEIFKRVGMDQIWRELGKQAPLKTFLGQATDGGCTSAASARLDEIMKERNGVAHPTSLTTFPDPDQVQDVVAYLRVLSRVTVDLALIPR